MPRDAKPDPAGIPLAPRDFLILLILAEGPTHGYGMVTAREKWTAPLTGCPGGSPTVGADNTVYVPIGGCMFGGTGNLEAFSPSGTLDWRFQVKGKFKVITGSTGIVADGTAYVVSQLTQDLYAVKTSSLGLADSSWPTDHRDNRNTGDVGVAGN